MSGTQFVNTVNYIELNASSLADLMSALTPLLELEKWDIVTSGTDWILRAETMTDPITLFDGSPCEITGFQTSQRFFHLAGLCEVYFGSHHLLVVCKENAQWFGMFAVDRFPFPEVSWCGGGSNATNLIPSTTIGSPLASMARHTNGASNTIPESLALVAPMLTRQTGTDIRTGMTTRRGDVVGIPIWYAVPATPLTGRTYYDSRLVGRVHNLLTTGDSCVGSALSPGTSALIPISETVVGTFRAPGVAFTASFFYNVIVRIPDE